MKRFVLFPLLLLTGLAACQREGVPPPHNTPPPSTPISSPVQDAITMTVLPASMDQCDPAVEALVKWDASVLPETTSVEIWVSDGGDFKLFGAGGAKGEAKTGPWTRPGLRFQARDPATKKILAEHHVNGPQC